MSKGFSRTYSLRKPIRPIIDIDEDDDEQRRDTFGRKRVDVVDCLLDSSSDEIDDGNVNIEKNRHILWLTLEEIRHIRYVLTRTSLISDKQYSQIRHGNMCFRCRKKISQFFFLPSFLRFTKHEICFICQQMICKKCSYTNFHPPSSKLSIPIRIQKLIKPAPITIEKKNEISNTQTQTVCYDCLQIFNEHIKTSQHPVTSFRRTFSLPPMSTKNNLNQGRYTRHRRRPLDKLEKQEEQTIMESKTKF